MRIAYFLPILAYFFASRAHAQIDGGLEDSIATKLGELNARGNDDGIAHVLEAIHQAHASTFFSDDFDLLAALESERSAQSANEDFRVALEIESSLDALERLGTTKAISAMVAETRAHRGAFRFDVARRIRTIGDPATPALILAKGNPALRRWASEELESIGKRVATDVVLTKNEATLIEDLAAFSVIRDRDAFSVVFAFTHSERKHIRDAARASILAYGAVGVPQLREIYTNLWGRAPDENNADAQTIANQIFALQDKQRLADLDALVDDGLKKQAAGDLVGAVAIFDAALAREPTLDRRAEMVPAFVARGDSLMEGHPEDARLAFEEALALDPETPRQSQIRSALAYLAAESLRARGIEDRAGFERAFELDPGNARAQERLDAIESRRHGDDLRVHRYAYAALAVLLLICTSVLVLFRKK